MENKDLSFIDHLEVLRWHLIRSMIAVIVFTTLSFIFMGQIFNKIILAPAKVDFWTYKMLCEIGSKWNIPGICIDKIDFTLQSRNLAGQFTMHITSSFVIGIIISFPYIIWEIWRFIKPALYPKEQKMATGTITFVTVLFALGILFGYYIVAPMSINFLANYKLDESILNQFDITSYISTLCMLVLGSGLMFQLPVLVLALSKFGIVTPDLMRKFRRHSVVVIFIISAIITPSPDILSQMLVAIPLLILYELSIFLSAMIEKDRQKELMSEN
jgi:sec-independent protein translocase protein TatC